LLENIQNNLLNEFRYAFTPLMDEDEDDLDDSQETEVFGNFFNKTALLEPKKN
jgi:hypothetical protein